VGTHQQHQGDWFGGLADVGDHATIHGRNFVRTVAGGFLGGALGLLGGTMMAVRAIRRVRRETTSSAAVRRQASDAEPDAAPDGGGM
jgi:hypothetical protein